MTRREWRDVPSSRRAAIAVAGTVQVALAASAWWDLSRRPADQVCGPKWLWSLVIAVNFAGPIAYFTAGRVPPRATDAGQSGQDTSPDATAIASALAGVPSTPADHRPFGGGSPLLVCGRFWATVLSAGDRRLPGFSGRSTPSESGPRAPAGS
ncbi:PLD nuclease N-terminal domain-containing protein [Amycolatopsis sp. NBC_00438]|uniref:PLD nuclease N-terminal domain-containing protein n=1 Tax=Amycolatopsis sp. NBC_00438 TaxID=2903558 RepID=UPI002E1B026E